MGADPTEADRRLQEAGGYKVGGQRTVDNKQFSVEIR